MKLLAFDTSSPYLSAAYFQDGALVSSKELIFAAKQSESLAAVLSGLLAENGVDVREIDVLAVGLGPGSFTGLRVGITTAKMMGYAGGMKITGVSSLAAMALDVSGWQGPIVVMLDAKKEKLYTAFYELGPKGLVETKAASIMTIKEVLARAKDQSYFVGNGIMLYKNQLLEAKKGSCFFSESDELCYPKARRIGELGIELAKKKKFIDPFKLEPNYLHPKDCNVTQKAPRMGRNKS